MSGGARAKARRDYQEERAALAELGATDEEIDAALASREPDEEEPFELWPENLEAFALFTSLETQWRVVAGFGATAWLGIDYAAAEAVMRMRRVKPAARAELFGDLRAMELAVLPILNKREDEE